MLFNSTEFLLFLPVAILFFFLTPHRFRWLVLLVASYFFYMSWEAKFIILILISTVVDYLVSLKLDQRDKEKGRKWLLALSVITNLGILMVFKYNEFFIENINTAIQSAGGRSQIPFLKLILPMGISFYTFQTMSYTIDVYRKRIIPERHLGYFALYVCYFPQLVAGPIERAENLIEQLRAKTNFTYENFSWGAKQAIWGMFKKVVIADRLAVVVDTVYNNPGQHDGLSIILATYLFAIQIYCDFSGYSDIAIGVSRMFGINLKINFNLPYIAQSFRDFWTRWHISLSGWFRDYLYIPLGGNKVKKARWLLNLFIVFVVSGFWHGAAWTFIIWGALHGIYLIIENLTGLSKESESKGRKILRKIVVFHLVCFAWIFFRANTTADSLYFVSNLGYWNLSEFFGLINSIGAVKLAFIFTILVGFLLIDKRMDVLVKKNKRFRHLQNQVVFSFITALILLFGFFGEAQFIYFQF